MAAVPSPQDVYARHLASGRGYPLWTPEPNTSLPATYREGGLKIGDVGVVVPEDGSFDVFFNVTLPPAHILHQETGVPDNFTPIPLGSRDITVFPEAEGAGRVISTSSVTREKKTDTADGDLESRVEPGLLNYQFTLSSREGAVLILPEGAERCYLRNERPFLEAAMQHAVDWYTFAEERLGRIISHDSLYLITGFYKARSWSLAAYQQGAGTGEASAQFKAVQVGGGNIPACYTWETTQAMDWRVGPSDLYYNGIPNQSVFISGFKIAVREGILGSKWVTVKADVPSARPYRAEFSSGPWFSNMWSGVLGSASGPSTSKWTGTGPNTDNNLDRDQPRDEVREDITIRRFPQVTKPFHPSDIINEHLLYEMPSATVAVTHDSQWTTLLQNGLLKPDELSQDRLVAEVASNYIPTLTQQGAVYLESRAVEVDVGDDAKMPAISSEPEWNPRLSPTPHDLDLLTPDDLSVKPYACAYGNLTDLELSHAMYHTAHELLEHVMFAHALAVGQRTPVFRCGLAGCGLSWESVDLLDYHIRFSGAHRDSLEDRAKRLFTKSPEFRQALPTLVPVRRGEPDAPTPDDISSEQFRGPLDLNSPFKKSHFQVSPMERNETEGNQTSLSCNSCKVRAIKCDRVHPACRHCQSRSLPCVYDDIKGKDKKGAESIPAPSDPGLSCQKCRALGLQCHSDPGRACVRCTRLSLRCEFKLVQDAVTPPAFQPKGAWSSGGSLVDRFVPRGRPDVYFADRYGKLAHSIGKGPIASPFSTNQSKQSSQLTTVERAPVNLKCTNLRMVPLTPPRDGFLGGPSCGLYNLEFEFDCDAPKCEIRIRQILPADYPGVSAGLLSRCVVDGGMGRIFKLEEGIAWELRRHAGKYASSQHDHQKKYFTCVCVRQQSGDRVSGPPLSVVDVAGTSGESEREKEFKAGTWEGVRLAVSLSPLHAYGMRVTTLNRQTTYLHINRMGTPPAGDADDTRPWVIKVIKREATRNQSISKFSPAEIRNPPSNDFRTRRPSTFEAYEVSQR